MRAEALRLREVLTLVRPEIDLPIGANDEAISRLQGAIAPRSVPVELVALLRVFDGSGSEDILLGQPGPLLSCEGILQETEQRAALQQDEPVAPWCPAWLVVTSAGHFFSAVLTAPGAIDRSPVIDLSYGNGSPMITTASLTGLVAASADAWEQGIHEHQTWDPKDDGSRFRVTYAARQALLEQWEPVFPSQEGLARDDEIGWFAEAWPATWPAPRVAGEPPYAPRPLTAAMTIESGIGVTTVVVAVLQRQGRWLRVEDASGWTWLYLAPGLEDRSNPVRVGTTWWLSVVYPHSSPLAPAPDGYDGAALRITGVLAER